MSLLHVRVYFAVPYTYNASKGMNCLPEKKYIYNGQGGKVKFLLIQLRQNVFIKTSVFKDLATYWCLTFLFPPRSFSSRCSARTCSSSANQTFFLSSRRNATSLLNAPSSNLIFLSSTQINKIISLKSYKLL